MAINNSSNLLELGLSGLRAAQQGLATTSHNIANANTPGYSRQRVELVADVPALSNGGSVGSGVRVAAIRRSYDEFLTRQLETDTAIAGEHRVHRELAVGLDTLLSDEATSLSPVLQGFFDAVEQAAASPASAAARQVLLGQADRLAERFQMLDERLQERRASVQAQAAGTVDQINSLAGEIANLNQRISQSGARGGPPNDLLDQRDELVRQLAERAGVTALVQGDGSVNVSLGRGQDLVVGQKTFLLAVSSRPADPRGISLALTGSGGSAVDVTDTISGGSLGAFLAFEQGLLADASRQLDQAALGVADAMNRQHRLGIDQTGTIGKDLFTAINTAELKATRALGDPANNGSGELEVSVDSVAALRDTEYRLTYDGAEYRLVDSRDGRVVGAFDRLPHAPAAEGFTIALAAGSIAAGDSFIIRPSAGAAGAMRRELPDAESLALASPVRSGAGSENLGSARITSVAAADLAGETLAAAITLTFDSVSKQFSVSSPPGGTLAYDPSIDSGAPLTLSVAGFGELTFSVTGAPVDKDRFVLEGNAGGTGDNRNALALSALRDAPLLLRGTATLAEGYERTVATTAGRAQALEIAAGASEKMLAHSADAREARSGVNLDEEATELLRYQRAYQAAARIIAAADEMFNTFLNAVAR